MSKELHPSLGPLKRWLLTDYRDSNEGISLVLPSFEPNLMFFPEGTIGGSGGCNRFFAGIEMTDLKVQIGLIASTLMYCSEPPQVMQQESDFFSCLSRSVRMELADDRLFFYDQQGNMLLRFKLDENFP